ncbi:MAG: translocation/assembly module TamB domain-containing protein [Bosea sp.]|uniref:translocation/assembly module TamB domain-containing protein n=1 Tax=unclassified Bosea (in: a-proteobacteria) TaxID=2653178 RepID=UPI000A4D0B91|nr:MULTISPECIES: translocation/assembly module TamB domain-containing protein [unclassified Bosea (in: a-proteobacteria)]MBN9456458.1 translocation/assembly module TamB domain-containing protein [Bosea sp. (in: a-proteobacteria)]
MRRLLTLPRLALFAVLLAGGILALGHLAGFAQNAQTDRGIVADLISKALSSDTSQVSIGEVNGALSSDVEIRDIVLSDRDGAWLRLDRLRLVWTRSALLLRRLDVDRLEIGKLEILRRPARQPTGTAPPSDGPILPELPLKVILRAFQLNELVLGEPVIGVAARLGATGAARLGPPNEGLDLKFEARRLDMGGTFNVDLSFVPESTRLRLAAKLDEPAGGLISKAAGLPGEPPVKLDLNGDGPLDSFRSNLTFTAGPTIGAEGSATVDRTGSERQLALALDARIEGLMPAPAAPVFAGSTKLDGTVGFADDGGIDIRNLALVSALARLDVLGRYNPDKTLDLHVTAASRPNAGGRTVASGTEIGKLAFDATIRGPVAGPTVAARLDAQDARLPIGQFGKVGLTFNATPSGSIGDAGTRIVLTSDGEATGIALADKALARAVGDKVTFTLRGTGNDDATADFETLRLALAGMELDYKGKLGQARVLGQLKAVLPDLSRLSGLARRPLGGRAQIVADLDATPKADKYAATLDGKAERVATGDAVVDRLLAGSLTLGGKVGALAGDYTFSGLKVAGQHATFTADGPLGQNASNLKLALALPDLKRADPRLSGRADVDAEITGPLKQLDAKARIALANATALARPIPRLAIDAVVKDLQGALDSHITLSGEVDAKPAAGTIALNRQPDDGWNLSQLALAIGSVRVDGAVTLDPSSRAAGRLTLAARNLDDLSALALTKLGGQLDADITLTTPEGRQNIDLTARGSRLAGPSVSIDKLDATIGAKDIYGHPMLDAAIAIDRAVAAGETISTIRFDSKGAPDASAFTLSANARGFALKGAGKLVPGEPLKLEIASFDARRDGRAITLANPATFSFPASGVEIAGLALAIDHGRVTLDGKAGDTLDLRFAARDVPLSAARIAAPGLDLSGTLNAQAQIQGRPDALSGPWSVKIARLATAETRQAGLPPVEIAGQGAFKGDATSVEATINAGRGASLSLRGTAPLNATGALSLAAQGRVDAALANTMLAVNGQRLTGAFAIDMRAEGTPSAPRLSGNATLSNGSFTDALQGIRLADMRARIAASGDNLTIESASARTPNGGTISASGQVKVDPTAGFPGTIRIQGNRAQLLSSGLVTAVAGLDLDISGPLAQRPRIGGRIDVDSLEVSVPDRLPASLRPVDGIKHVHAKGTAAARLAAARKARQARARKGRAGPAFDAALALTVSAPNRVFIRGRGIDAELGGEIRVGGTLAAPALDGGFELRRGRLNVLTQRLDFSRGRLTFAGGLIPQLDFVAETRAADVTAKIIVSGPADQPAFAFTSEPQLPQDEVLSRLLFARASGSLSPFQAVQLAQAAAQFAGGGGDDTFERLRKSLGVDNLDIQMGEGGPTVGASRYISDNVSVGVKVGTKPEDSGVSVGIDLTKRLKLQAETGADGSAAVGLGAEWEY